MVTKLGTIAGINITASHNPTEYNGYKAYWEDGCQVSSAVADGMTEKIQGVQWSAGGGLGVEFAVAPNFGIYLIKPTPEAYGQRALSFMEYGYYSDDSG